MFALDPNSGIYVNWVWLPWFKCVNCVLMKADDFAEFSSHLALSFLQTIGFLFDRCTLWWSFSSKKVRCSEGSGLMWNARNDHLSLALLAAEDAGARELGRRKQWKILVQIRKAGEKKKQSAFEKENSATSKTSSSAQPVPKFPQRGAFWDKPSFGNKET